MAAAKPRQGVAASPRATSARQQVLPVTLRGSFRVCNRREDAMSAVDKGRDVMASIRANDAGRRTPDTSIR